MQKYLFILLFSLCVPLSASSQSSDEGPKLFMKRGHFGFRNKQGKIVIPAIFDSAFAFREYMTPVKQKGKWYYIDTFGKPALREPDGKPLYFAHARPFFHHLAVVQRNIDSPIPQLTYIDLSGAEAFVDFSADMLDDMKEGYAQVKQGGKFGVINSCQEKLLDIIYDRIDSFSMGYGKVWLYGQCRYVDEFGRTRLCTSEQEKRQAEDEMPGLFYFSSVSKQPSPESYKKMDQLASQMNEHPERRYVLSGYGADSYADIQSSWDCVNTVFTYLLERKGIDPKRLIFRYGLAGQRRTVDFHIAEIGEEWQPRTPMPFAGYSCPPIKP